MIWTLILLPGCILLVHMNQYDHTLRGLFMIKAEILFTAFKFSFRRIVCWSGPIKDLPSNPAAIKDAISVFH